MLNELILIHFCYQLVVNQQQAEQLEKFAAEKDELAAENDQLKALVLQLQQQLAVNSRNSHKPPSSDGPRQKNTDTKTKKTRKPSDKKPGGQKDHPGRTLEAVEQPDQVVPLPVDECAHCHASLLDQLAKDQQHCQVFDLPPIKLQVTEYQAEVKDCPHCGQTTTADFPAHVTQPVQYGPVLKSMSVYLMDYQLLPYERTAELIEHLTGQPISAGSLSNFREQCAANLTTFEEAVKEVVSQAETTNFDETGMKADGKTQWLHVASTESATFYAVHEKRGQIAMDDIGILPEFKGTAVHDNLTSYFKYDCQHGLCNAHHQRELTWAIEQEQADWAQDLFDCLLNIKAVVDQAKADGLDRLEPQIIDGFEARYDRIIEQAYNQWVPAHPPPPSPPGKKGRKKQTKAKNLLDRLKKNKAGVLCFMHDFTVPYDNNLAERDLRMMKLKLKISGVFRTQKGARNFCLIRSYISTAKKRHWNVLESINKAVTGKPRMPGMSVAE